MSLNSNNIYKDYSKERNWSEMFSTSKQEEILFEKYFKNIELDCSNLLDIGFGQGSLLAWARQRGAFISGVEIQDDLLAIALEKGVTTFTDLRNVPAESNDIVVLFDVLEHISMDDIPSFLKDILRVLKPGGIVLMRFPNCQSSAGLANQFGDYTHLSMLSGPVVEYYSKQVGFTNVYYQGSPEIASDKFQNRIAKLLLRPLLYIFEYGYRLTFSDRATPLTPNILLQAKKTNG